MKRSQIIILIVALLAIVGIYFLPRVVVNKKEIAQATTPSTSTDTTTAGHGSDLTPSQQAEIKQLHREIEQSDIQSRESAILKLAEHFIKIKKFDSAAYYYETVAMKSQSPNLYFTTGNAYYEALTYAVNSQKASKMGEKARYWLDKASEANPSNVEAKAKSALTYVNSDTPMQGIMKLRSLAEEHPDNEFVQYNMGILSFQSNQFDKAVARFEKVVAINPKSVNGYFYLALSLKELGKKSEAIKYFKKVAELDKSEEIQTTVSEQLAELGNN